MWEKNKKNEKETQYSEIQGKVKKMTSLRRETLFMWSFKNGNDSCNDTLERVTCTVHFISTLLWSFGDYLFSFFLHCEEEEVEHVHVAY